jgi:hypothetical protein
MEAHMKNIYTYVIALITTTTLSTIQLSAYSNKNKQTIEKTQKIQPLTNNKRKPKKPEYYRGRSDGLQNWPGKTIDAGINTGMLSTNSSSYMGNDISF